MADRTNPEPEWRHRPHETERRVVLIIATAKHEYVPTCADDHEPWPCDAETQRLRADRAEARVAALTEAVEGLRKDHGAQNRIGIIGPDGHAGAWAALGAVLCFLEGKPIAPPPFDYEDYARRRAALATPEAPEPRSPEEEK